MHGRGKKRTLTANKTGGEKVETLAAERERERVITLTVRRCLCDVPSALSVVELPFLLQAEFCVTVFLLYFLPCWE
jgi:hypothetical protein